MYRICLYSTDSVETGISEVIVVRSSSSYTSNILPRQLHELSEITLYDITKIKKV